MQYWHSLVCMISKKSWMFFCNVCTSKALHFLTANTFLQSLQECDISPAWIISWLIFSCTSITCWSALCLQAKLKSQIEQLLLSPCEPKKYEDSNADSFQRPHHKWDIFFVFPICHFLHLIEITFYFELIQAAFVTKLSTANGQMDRWHLSLMNCDISGMSGLNLESAVLFKSHFVLS